jgi:hypothetical protein
MARKTVERRAQDALAKVEKMIHEITAWKGERPKIVRVNQGDYLALVEVGKVDHFPGVEIKPG